MSPAAGYGAPPPAGGYGLGANPYAPPQASFDEALPMECPQANTALKYAIVGLFCFGVILGPLAIKNALGRPDFRVDPRLLRRGLLDNLYAELPVEGSHAVAVDLLPPLHRDPFDRLLIAQAQVEGLLLLTADATVARYPGSIRLV